MKKFNIRKVLDGLKEQASSSASSGQSGTQENNLMQETLQSEHFQLCKVGESDAFYYAAVSNISVSNVSIFLLHIGCRVSRY